MTIFGGIPQISSNADQLGRIKCTDPSAKGRIFTKMPDAPDASANVFDVARVIVRKLDSMGQMKLHKLLYYCQANAMVWFNRPIFSNRIEAWANGPVIPDLWNENRYRSWIELSDLPGNESVLSSRDLSCVDAVLSAFGGLTGGELSIKTHSESPWNTARVGIPEGVASSKQIDIYEMGKYYSTLWKSQKS